MVKRLKASFTGANNYFRISNPGFNVDTATGSQLAIDETVFYGQLLQTGYVTNPASRVVTVPLTYDIGFPPLVLAYTDASPVGFSRGTFFNVSYYYKDSSVGFTGDLRIQSNRTNFVINFSSGPLIGAYYQVYRRQALV